MWRELSVSWIENFQNLAFLFPGYEADRKGVTIEEVAQMHNNRQKILTALPQFSLVAAKAKDDMSTVPGAFQLHWGERVF